jgi:hypothetical protein
MNKHRKLLTPSRTVELERRLSRVPEVMKFDEPGEPQGHTIAHALSGWEHSFTEILDVLLPKLLENEEATSEDLNDTLHDIGDELRHILYHIHDTRYFGYLLDNNE